MHDPEVAEAHEHYEVPVALTWNLVKDLVNRYVWQQGEFARHGSVKFYDFIELKVNRVNLRRMDHGLEAPSK